MANTIVACGIDGIFRTTDGGLSWNQVYALPCANVSYAEGVSYGIVNSAASTWTLVKSIDDGVSWISAGGVKSWTAADFTDTYSNNANGYSLIRVVNMGNNTLIVINPNNIEQSTNDDIGPWNVVYGSPIAGYQVINTVDGNAIATQGYPSHRYWEISNYGSTVNAFTPTSVTPGITYLSLYGYLRINPTTIVCCGRLDQFFFIQSAHTLYSNDNGATWAYTAFGSSSYAKSMLQLSSGTLLVGISQNGQEIHQSVDNGASWTLLSSLPSPQVFIQNMIEDDPGIVIAASWTPAGTPTLYRSPDSGATWAPVLLQNLFAFEILGGSPSGSGGFTNNYGTVVLKDICEFDTTSSDPILNNLQVDAITSMDGSCTVNNLILSTGSIANANAHIIVKGDIETDSSYNDWSENNNVHLTMDATDTHYITTGGVLPSLWIDKTDSSQIILEGTNPLYVRGPFIIKDGTFNSNGLNVQVGSASNSDAGSLAILD